MTELNGEAAYAVVTTSDQVKIRVLRRDLTPNQKVTMAIRPEYITVQTEAALPVPENVNRLVGEVIRAAYLGDVIDYRIGLGQWILLIIPPERVTIIPELD